MPSLLVTSHQWRTRARALGLNPASSYRARSPPGAAGRVEVDMKRLTKIIGAEDSEDTVTLCHL